MKKSNVIIFALLAAASVFFLWLWYYLGLNHVDEPLDLVLSIIWWVVIVAAVIVVVKMEQVRRQRVRTVYVGGDATFNSEKGLMRFEGTKPMQAIVASILENLKYDFTRNDFPERDAFDVKYFIRTKEFDVEKKEEGPQQDGAADVAVQPDPAEQAEPIKWKGEVVMAGTGEERAFDTPDELAVILASLEQTAA